MYFSLARDLGCTVAELLGRISSSELTEWMAWYQLEEEDAAKRAPGTQPGVTRVPGRA